jgi:hypothetical protein
VRNEDADVDKTSDRIFNFMIFLIIIFGLREKSVTDIKIANTVKRLVVKNYVISTEVMLLFVACGIIRK